MYLGLNITKDLHRIYGGNYNTLLKNIKTKQNRYPT